MKARAKRPRAEVKVHSHPGEPAAFSAGAYFDDTRARFGSTAARWEHVWVEIKRSGLEVALHFEGPAEARRFVADLGASVETAIAEGLASAEVRGQKCTCGHARGVHARTELRCYETGCGCAAFAESAPSAETIAGAGGGDQ